MFPNYVSRNAKRAERSGSAGKRGRGCVTPATKRIIGVLSVGLLCYVKTSRGIFARVARRVGFSLGSTPSVSPNTAVPSSRRRTPSAQSVVMTRSPLVGTPTSSTGTTAGTRWTICDECGLPHRIGELEECLMNGLPALICWRCKEKFERWL